MDFGLEKFGWGKKEKITFTWDCSENMQIQPTFVKPVIFLV